VNTEKLGAGGAAALIAAAAGRPQAQ
jgi:hypothetical protein